MLTIIALAPLALLIAISSWVWKDATRRDMNPRWGIAVGLLLIVFLPLYLAVRKPVKCGGCGKPVPSSAFLCEGCEQLKSNEEGAARAGRIFG